MLRTLTYSEVVANRGNLPGPYPQQHRELGDNAELTATADAAGFFSIFISAYTVAFGLVARMMLERGFIIGASRLLKRVLAVIYVAHVFLFVLYLAEIGYLAQEVWQRWVSPMNSTSGASLQIHGAVLVRGAGTSLQAGEHGCTGRFISYDGCFPCRYSG